MNLDSGHIKLVPGRITVLIPVKDGKGDLGRLFVGEESSNVTQHNDVAPVPTERVEKPSSERFRLVGRSERGGDLVVRRVGLQDGLSGNLGRNVSEGAIRTKMSQPAGLVLRRVVNAHVVVF